MKYCFYLLSVITLTIFSNSVQADKVRIASASNFMKTARELAKDFRKKTSHTIVLSFGSTGKLYAQIINGAPFDIFLSADVTRPAILEKNEQTVPGTRFTYALGSLVLLTSSKELPHADGKILQNTKLEKLAIANPKTAPYGIAALEVLQNMKVKSQLQNRLIYGENIAQTYQFIATGAVKAGFVSKSQIKKQSSNQSWEIPKNLYSPIKQQAVLLKKAKNNPAALAFIDYLKSPKARKIITKHGYNLENR